MDRKKTALQGKPNHLGSSMDGDYHPPTWPGRTNQGRKKPRSNFPGQVKMGVLWSAGQVKLASIVLLVIISNQKQFQILTLQHEQNNQLKAWINSKSKHTL